MKANSKSSVIHCGEIVLSILFDAKKNPHLTGLGFRSFLIKLQTQHLLSNSALCHQRLLQPQTIS
jgi:hypothetical protein